MPMSHRGALITLRALAGLAGAPALLLTALRLTAGNNPVLAKMVAFAPYAIALYAVAATLLCATWLAAGRRSWVAATTTLLLLGGAGLHLAWIAPLYVGTTPRAAPGSTPLVVMNANMDLGRGDATDVVDAVRRHGVALLVLEEVTPALLARLDAAGLPGVLPHAAGQPRDGGNGTMAFSTMPITDVHRIATGLDSWSMSVAGLRVLAVHPAFAWPTDTWPSDQATVLRAVRTLHPDLLVGDLNATLDHAAVRSLEHAGLADGAVQANAGWTPTWPANGLVDVAGVGLPPLVQIDHIMVGSRLGVRTFHAVAVRTSDHRGVIATVIRRRR